MSDDLEQELRATLNRHAAEAPRGDMLAERIIHAADQASAASRRRSFPRWSLPLIAAVAVGAVVAAAVAIASYHPAHHESPALTSGSATVSQTASPTTAPTTSPTAAPTTATVPVTDQQQVEVLDLTFVGDDEGWALASAKCEAGSGRCLALLHTTDGRRWPSIGRSFGFNVPGVVNCAEPCVTNIRFVDSRIGYAYGPDAVFMTTDGGENWTQQKGLGALALESANGNVIRVFAKGGRLEVATAANGSTEWHDAALPASLPATAGVQVTRTNGADAYLAAGTELYRTSDNGASWQPMSGPCLNGSVPVISAGGEARVSILCRNEAKYSFVAVSSDRGDHWTGRGAVRPAATARLFTGDANTVLVTADDGLSVSFDGGKSWNASPEVTGKVGFLGFESSTVGRAVSRDGKTIWTTSDGGRSWSPTVLP